MSESRPFALIRTGDQWVRGAFDRTALDYDDGVVELAWSTSTQDSDSIPPVEGAGLAFDTACRLYHSLPESGRVDLVRWGARDPLSPGGGSASPISFFAALTPTSLGDFVAPMTATALREPRGLCVDGNDRLFVAETAADQILVYDLWSRRLLRRVSLPGARPTDLAVHTTIVWAVLASERRVIRLTSGGGPDNFDLPHGCDNPSRIALSPSGTLVVLCDGSRPTAEAWVLAANGKVLDRIPEAFATDVEWESDLVLVVARQPGADFKRYRVEEAARETIGPLRARGYDGLGIVRAPDRIATKSHHDCTCTGNCSCDGDGYRIGYWTSGGLRLAVPARLVYESTGTVSTYRLDSGAFQTQWGRLFLDACIPEGTEIRVHAVALDEPDDNDLLPRTPPPNLDRVTIARPDLSPPMIPASLAPREGALGGRVHWRESGREIPWAQPSSDDPFRTYEAWIPADAGRYLWLTLELRGNTRVTPRVRCLRAEHPAHDYLRRLPRLFSREEADASFLRRYLAVVEGFLGEIEARAVDRSILLSPRATPDEALPWLASFVGLILDERWSRAPRPGGRTSDARREIIELAAWLFKNRGTVAGLRRFIELYVGAEVVLLEHFRLRGGMQQMLGAATVTGSDARAHRFTVLIPASLTEEELDVVRQILSVHRPAHTIFDVCTVGAGMRAGRGLHVGISSIVGPTGGFGMLRLGTSALGRGAIIGHPVDSIKPGTSRVGEAKVR
jgi:phage tail-like protein